jgi:hypothetical protein
MLHSRIGTHLRGNVVAYLALFVALSGTAYAASLGKNSVHSKQLAPGSVRASEIKGGAVQLKHIGFPLGASSAAIPDTAVGQGAEPHLFTGPGLNPGGGTLLGVSNLTLTTPAAAPGSPATSAHVHVTMEVRGVIVEDKVLDVADGETTSISMVGNAGDINGFQEVNERVGVVGANINVDGGSTSALAIPPPTPPAGP